MQTYKKEEDDSVEDQDSVNGITKREKKKLGKIGIHNLNEYSLCNSKKLFYWCGILEKNKVNGIIDLLEEIQQMIFFQPSEMIIVQSLFTEKEVLMQNY